VGAALIAASTLFNFNPASSRTTTSSGFLIPVRTDRGSTFCTATAPILRGPRSICTTEGDSPEHPGGCRYHDAQAGGKESCFLRAQAPGDPSHAVDHPADPREQATQQARSRGFRVAGPVQEVRRAFGRFSAFLEGKNMGILVLGNCLVTGDKTHYLLQPPSVIDCRYHDWSNCYAEGVPSSLDPILLHVASLFLCLVDSMFQIA